MEGSLTKKALIISKAIQSDLIDRTLSETSWNLGRNVKQALPKLKRIGDFSAHSRRYNAHRSDIDKIAEDLRIVVQELVNLVDFKNKSSSRS